MQNRNVEMVKDLKLSLKSELEHTYSIKYGHSFKLSVMAKFANVNVDSVRYFQTTDFTHLHRMSNLIDYIRSVYRDLGKDTRLMTLPQDGTLLHISMIEYFTKFRHKDRGIRDS